MVLSETTGEDTIYYLHGLGLVAESDGTSTDYFLTDGLGSVRQLTNAAATPLLAQTFDPYGNLYASAGAGASAFGFSGEYTDASGLLYLRARYYNPAQGRFFQRDAWSGNPNQPRTLNEYSYAAGNPIMLSDPSGHCYDMRQFLEPLGPLTPRLPSPVGVWNECKENISRFGETLNDPNATFGQIAKSFYFNVTPFGVTWRETMVDTAEDFGAVNRWFHDHEY